MDENAEILNHLDAIVQEKVMYASFERCSRCGFSERYVKGRKCVECARLRRVAAKIARDRRRAGLPALKAAREKERVRALKVEDERQRAAAARAGAKRYAGSLPCTQGHRPIERYTSSGGCVRCAAASARRRYVPVARR